MGGRGQDSQFAGISIGGGGVPSSKVVRLALGSNLAVVCIQAQQARRLHVSIW